MKTYPVIYSSLVLALAMSASAADRSQEINAFLNAFQKNPKAAMDTTPTKKNARGEVIHPSRFSPQEVRNKDYIQSKDQARQKICTIVNGTKICLGDVIPGRAPFEDNDQASNLVDNGQNLVKNLSQMEQMKLRSAKLKETPWSDNYWPIYQGILGNRYADSQFSGGEDWKKYHDYVLKNDANTIFASRTASKIDALSPSEKYDLLVGDNQLSLTESMWSQGEEYYRSSGKVETWMGICHGWAPAAFMDARPTNVASVIAADGKTKLNFYPSDIKALSSLLWASTSTNTKFIGGRCDAKDPKTDANGRVIDQDCFDTNPGSWHMTVVNQIGVSKRSFVIDATYDYEVWNQPVYSYSYTYFNPLTNKAVSSLEQAKVAISDLKNDKFAKYRSSQTKFVVGVSMELGYVVETDPSHATKDAPSNDSVNTVTYMYDLELDADGNIVGGEWYQNRHVDFAWVPVVGSKATTAGDRMIRTAWDGKSAVGADWKKAAQATSRNGSPLAKVVEKLIELSRTSQTR